MGFLELLNATALGAFYDPVRRELTLSATIEIRVFTTGIKFAPDEKDDLKYSLEGWVGPLTNQTDKVEYQQTFTLSFPSPPKCVTIRDAAHPQGTHVEIRYGGLLPPKGSEKPKAQALKVDDAAPTSQTEAGPTSPTKALSLPQKNIWILGDKNSFGSKGIFTISQRSEVPKMGTINIKFDPAFLSLQDAGINDTDIVWTFQALQIGDTQVIVTIHGGIAGYVVTQIYNIHVMPVGHGPVIPPSKEPETLATLATSDLVKNASPGSVSAILGYLGRAEIALRIVQKQYPGAAIFNIYAWTNDVCGTDSAESLPHITVLLRLENGDKAQITNTTYDEFGPVEVTKGPWVGSANLVWFPSMSAADAEKRLRELGYEGKFTSLTLSKPLFPGVEEDLYTFQMVDGTAVDIPTKTKNPKV
jgi:hypothetical protein